MRHIRIASRASRLVLVQKANHIRDLLQKLLCNVEISIIKVSIKSDRNKSDFLYKSESVGFFTSEIEKTLLNTQADITVHSLKDLPAGATVGTSSLRRIAQLKHRGRDLKDVPLRENIETRKNWQSPYYQSNVTSFKISFCNKNCYVYGQTQYYKTQRFPLTEQ